MEFLSPSVVVVMSRENVSKFNLVFRKCMHASESSLTFSSSSVSPVKREFEDSTSTCQTSSHRRQIADRKMHFGMRKHPCFGY